MEKTRFQYTLRGMLWATFWVAVCATAWTVIETSAFNKWPWELQFLPTLILAVSPILAIVAIFGRTRLAVFVMAAVHSAFILFMVATAPTINR
ncbi:MAG: hypothetical protein K8T25_08200 [Planctomycetia bacterium]|nr:hypothetical protein [Planctomycetia bacterium]